MAGKIRVRVWNENRHEQSDPNVAAVYPEGIHGAIAFFLGQEADMSVSTAVRMAVSIHGPAMHAGDSNPPLEIL